MPWGVVGGIAGALISSDAQGDAADAQAQASKDSNALQKYIYDDTVERQQPWYNLGTAGVNRLAMLLGLDMPQEATEPGKSGAPTIREYAAIRESLLPKYTTNKTTYNYSASDGDYGQPIGTPTIDEKGLRKAIEAELAKDQSKYNTWANTQQQTATGKTSKSPLYGSLLKQFTGANLQNDPGYQFGLGEGNKAINRQLAAQGMTMSGAAAKALTRFGQDYAGTKFNEAFNRDQVQKNQIFNMLSGASGTGQTAANQVSSAGQNYATNVGNNLIGASNAQAAAGIGQAQTWNNALNSGISAWNQYQRNKPSTGYGFNTGQEGMSPNTLSYFYS